MKNHAFSIKVWMILWDQGKIYWKEKIQYLIAIHKKSWECALEWPSCMLQAVWSKEILTISCFGSPYLLGKILERVKDRRSFIHWGLIEFNP